MKTTFSISGNSPVRSSLREKHNTDKGKFNTEMISREESPTWSTARRKELDYAESKNENEELPSWDALEATLNRRLCNYALPESLDEGVGEKLRYERTTQEWFPHRSWKITIRRGKWRTGFYHTLCWRCIVRSSIATRYPSWNEKRRWIEFASRL